MVLFPDTTTPPPTAGVRAIARAFLQRIADGATIASDDDCTGDELLADAILAVDAVMDGDPVDDFYPGLDDVGVLAHAGALIAAEIDRRLRARPPEGGRPAAAPPADGLQQGEAA